MKVCVKNGEFGTVGLSSLKVCSTNWNGMFSIIQRTRQTWHYRCLCVGVYTSLYYSFFTHSKYFAIKTHRQLTLIFSNIMTIQHVRKWCREFSEGWRDVHDAVWSSRPPASTEDTVNMIRALLDEDRRLSIRQLTNIGRTFPKWRGSKKIYYAIFFKFARHILPHIDAKTRPALR